MPLSGLRGAGANSWFQDGALWFYPGHSGAQDENSCLLKLGALRLTPEGADFKSAKRFRQELDLPSGSIRIDAEAQDGTTLDARLWFAGETLVIEMKFSHELSLLAEYGSWRVKADDPPTAREQVTQKDQSLFFVHRNGHCPAGIRQGEIPERAREAVVNPAQDRVFGGVLAARGGLSFAPVVRWNGQIWKGHAWPARTIAAKEHVFTMALGAAQKRDPAQWAARARSLLKRRSWPEPKQPSRRSGTNSGAARMSSSGPAATTNDPVAQIGRNYQLYRYMAACNRDGELPLRFKRRQSSAPIRALSACPSDSTTLATCRSHAAPIPISCAGARHLLLAKTSGGSAGQPWQTAMPTFCGPALPTTATASPPRRPAPGPQGGQAPATSRRSTWKGCAP